jgi:hypothetical protein
MTSGQVADKYMKEHGVSSVGELSREQAKELTKVIEANLVKQNLYDPERKKALNIEWREKLSAALDNAVTSSLMVEFATSGMCLVGTKDQKVQASTILLNTMDSCNDLQDQMMAMVYPLALSQAIMEKQEELRKLQEDIH